MGHVAVPGPPSEEAVELKVAPAPPPAVADVAQAAPERMHVEGDGGDGRIIRQHAERRPHVLRAVELVDVDLPEVVAGGALGVGSRLRRAVVAELVRLRPEAVTRDDLDLVEGVLLGLEPLQDVEGAVGRMAVGRRHGARVLVAALDDDDLVGEGIERAQAVARERLTVQHDDPEGHTRGGRRRGPWSCLSHGELQHTGTPAAGTGRAVTRAKAQARPPSAEAPPARTRSPPPGDAAPRRRRTPGATGPWRRCAPP